MKKPLTPEQTKEREAEKVQKRNYKSATTKAKNVMKAVLEKQGLRIAELQLLRAKEIQTEPVVKISIGVITLNRDEIISCYESAISEYKELLQSTN